MLPEWLYWTLLIAFNLFWMITYGLVIRRGFLDRLPGIPLFALTLNLAWDFSGAFLIQSPMAQEYINVGYLAINLVISWQWFRFWRNDYRGLDAGSFYWYWAVAMVGSFAFILVGSQELGDVLLFKVGFVDNFVNSALFIAMLHRRDGLGGQSLYIGLAKMLGTASISITGITNPYPGLEDSQILPWLFAGIFVLDVTYVVQYWRKARRLGIDPLRRW